MNAVTVSGVYVQCPNYNT